MTDPDFEPNRLASDLAQFGYAVRPLLDPETCRTLEGLYDQDPPFRKRIVMEKHGYGRGEYKYFAYPLPPVVAGLRAALYPSLAAVANGWRQALGQDSRFPATLAAYLDRCHVAGQTRPTPLLLRYREEGFNCLHQDLYGEHVFPLQLVVMLSDPDTNFTGGELLLVEQRPRAQSKGEVVRPRQGDAVIFPVRERPVRGARGYHRVVMRHGVSRVLSGSRHTLGIIFHDAA
jgi:hypothetical protein